MSLNVGEKCMGSKSNETNKDDKKILGVRKELQDLDDYPIKRDIGDFKRIINQNLDYLMENKEFDVSAVRQGSKGKYKRLRQRELAFIIDSSSTTVNHWLNWKNPVKSVPDARALYYLSRGFGVDIEFLLNDNKDVFVDKVYTYWSCFKMLDDLNKMIGLETKNNDLFLDYLLSESEKLRSIKSLDPEIKIQWLLKIKKDFDRPLIQDVFCTRTGYELLTFTHISPVQEIQYPPYERMVEIFNILADYWESKDSWDFLDFIEYCRKNDIDCDTSASDYLLGDPDA